MSRWVLLQEMLAAVHQTHPNLLPQGLGVHEPLDLMLSQKSEAPTLPSLLLHLLGELYEQRWLLVLDALKPGHVEPSDLAAGDAEDLAQSIIGYVRSVVSRGHQSPVPELDQVINLCAC